MPFASFVRTLLVAVVGALAGLALVPFMAQAHAAASARTVPGGGAPAFAPLGKVSVAPTPSAAGTVPSTVVDCTDGWQFSGLGNCLIQGTAPAGFQRNSYVLDGAGTIQGAIGLNGFAVQFPVPVASGIHTATAWTTDVNGQAGPVATDTFKLDRDPPNVDIPLHTIGANCAVTWPGVKDQANLSGLDLTSFVAQYSLDANVTNAIPLAGAYSSTTETYHTTIPASACKPGTAVWVTLSLKDIAGNPMTSGSETPEGIWTKVSIPVAAAPTTTVTCPSGWQKAAQDCTVQGSAAAGFKRNTTGIDAAPSANTTTNPATISVATEGVHQVNATTTDIFDVTGAVASASVRIDLTNPTGSAATTKHYDGCPVVWAGVTDALSGVDAAGMKPEYSTDGGATWKPLGGGYTPVTKEFDAALPTGVCATGTTVKVRLLVPDSAGNQVYIGGAGGTTLTVPASTDPSTVVDCPAGWWNGPKSCTVTGTTTGAGFDKNRFSVDGTLLAASTVNPSTVPIATEGVHSVVATTTDLNEVTGPPANGTLKIDLTKPTGMFSSLLHDGSGCEAQFSTIDDALSGVDAAGFDAEYSTDGGATWKKLTTKSYTPSEQLYIATIPAGACAAGTTIKVRLGVTDKAGNKATVGGAGGTTVTVPPSSDPSTVVDCPVGWWNGPKACTVTGTAPNGFAFNTTSLDGGPGQKAFASPSTVSVTTEGVHAITATTTDDQAVTGAPASGQLKLDLTAPNANVPTIAAGCVLAWSGVDDALSGVDATQFVAQYSTDGGTTWKLLAAGTYSAAASTYSGPAIPVADCKPGTSVRTRMTVYDLAGNKLSVGGTAGTTIAIPSAGAPSTTVVCPAGWHKTAQDCTVTGTAGDGFKRNTTGIDVTPFVTSATNPTTVHVASEGVHQVNATTTDVAGTTGPVASATVKIDLTDPTAGIPAFTACSVLWSDVDDALSGIDATAFAAEYSTDGGTTWKALLGGVADAAAKTYKATIPAGTCTPGTTVNVRLVFADNAGNTASTGGLDGTPIAIPPVNAPTTVVACPAGWRNVSPQSCTITGTAAAGVKHNSITVDAGAVTTDTTNPSAKAVAGEGVHTVFAATTDQNGVTGAFANDTVKIDLTNPVGTAPTLAQGCTVTFTGIDDALSGIDAGGFTAQYSADGGTTWKALTAGAYSAAGKSYLATVPAPDCVAGSIKVRLKEQDAAGNATTVGGSTGSTVTLDPPASGAPTTSVVCPTGWLKVSPQSCTITGTAAAGVKHNSITVGGGAVSIDTTNPSVKTVSGEGVHQVSATTTDTNGVTGAKASGTVKIDLTDPTGTAPSGQIDTGCAVTFTAVDDALSGIDGTKLVAEYSTDGGTTWKALAGVAHSTGAHTVTATVPAAGCVTGTIRVRLTVVDNAGNAITVGGPGGAPVVIPPVSTDHPKVKVDCPAVPASGWFKTSVDCAVSATVTGGVSNLKTDLDGGAATNGADLGRTVAVTAEGDHAVHATVTDVATRTASDSATVRIDRTAPVAVGPGRAMPARCVVTWTGVTDALSGIDPAAFTAEYSRDNGTRWTSLEGGAYDAAGKTYTAQVPAADCAAGTYRLRLKATDVAGNATFVGSEQPGNGAGTGVGDPGVPPGGNPGGGTPPGGTPSGGTPPGGTPPVGTPPGVVPGGGLVAGGGGQLVSADARCSPNKLRLIDVYPSKNRVQLLGVAPANTVGQKVKIYFAGGKKPVISLKVAKDLSFKGSVKLPPKKLRTSSKARYQAKLGKQSTTKLKLSRRMFVYSVSQTKAGKVKMTGTVIRPIQRKQKVQLRVTNSCKTSEHGPIVASVTPKANGSFSITVKVPKKFAKVKALYVRAQTRVPKRAGNKRTSFTATLTRGVSLR